jgi:hypothetical protein
MKNRRSATGVGAGELSEYLLSLALLERYCRIDSAALHAGVTAAAARGQRHVTVAWTDAGTARQVIYRQVIYRQVIYRFDGKTLEAAREYAAHLHTPNALVRELAATAASVSSRLALPSLLRSPIRELHALGGSGAKADLTIYGASGATLPLSLKYAHHAATRYQSPTWPGVARAYRSIGADITEERDTYLDAHRQFMTPQLRHSRARGDYSTALRANCDAIVAAHHQINTRLAAHPDRIDTAALTAGILRGYTGQAGDIHLIDMCTGEIVHLHPGMRTRLDALLESSPLTVTTWRSDSGRTIELRLHAAEVEIAKLYTTASTNPARRQSNRDLRTPKPQTYLIPNLSLLHSDDAHPSAGAPQPVQPPHAP